MEPGKLSAQTGHAYGDVLHEAKRLAPERVAEYQSHERRGSKVSLYARNQNQLLRALNEARAAGIPAVPVVDANHVIPGTAFDGSPVITAIGIGPCTKAEIRDITKRFNCV
ncbi:peptidyl-tRNA hydrolase [Candidatus Poribacteria bacterium]|nr:peptidyl-tRNA hydrolase [Candidatus Poribacteria bacterium]MCP4261289.1 peptidyl-tRNA hydrolase [Planctomycetota bacterium]|tara:strand:- start:285 stop:617 length:333 start_codon:yes stop_codon:yes gene_type:complete